MPRYFDASRNSRRFPVRIQSRVSCFPSSARARAAYLKIWQLCVCLTRSGRACSGSNRSGGSCFSRILNLIARLCDGRLKRSDGAFKMRVLPDRLNLSIGNLCWLHCPGCYSYFGQGQARLDQIAISVREFVGLGADRVTISGGDPLRIAGIVEFLTRLRRLRVRSLKLDTVGTAFLPSQRSRYELSIENVLEKLDVLALPLDGWSNASVALFRAGRPMLYDETCYLLSRIDDCGNGCRIHVNTVVHRGNLGGVCAILQRLMSFRCVSKWSVFE